MDSRLNISSKPTHWVAPRPYTDAGLRRHHYGPIQPAKPEKVGLNYSELIGVPIAMLLVAAAIWGWAVIG